MKLDRLPLLLPFLMLLLGDFVQATRRHHSGSRPRKGPSSSSSSPDHGRLPTVNDLVESSGPSSGRRPSGPALSSNDPERGGRSMSPGLALLVRNYSQDPTKLKSSKDALIITKKNYLKKDWCKTEPLVQKIREPGCLSRTIVNRFCYGQCNSFYIPKNARQDMELTAFKSCSFCKPKRFTWITITLTCPGRNPAFKKKKIQRVKQCKCISEILQ